MNLADPHSEPMKADFRAEALRWLPNVARYARLLTRNEADADDLAQETFLRAFLNWSQFRPGSDCRKWLFTICRHLFLRAEQRGRTVVQMEDADADIQRTGELYWEAAGAGLQNLFDRMDVAPALERGLRDLQADYRAAVIMIDVEGYSYAEAAVALGVPIGTVRSRLFRARRVLQEALIDQARDLGLGTSSAHRGERRPA